MSLPIARSVTQSESADDRVILSYDARFMRRKVLTSANGLDFLVDLPKTQSLVAGDAFVLEDGRLIGVEAAHEDLLEIRGNLSRLAWHIGNRHMPCQIEAARLLIQKDHVIEKMLRQLGATVQEVRAPFTPERGAYGHGQTHSHAH